MNQNSINKDAQIFISESEVERDQKEITNNSLCENMGENHNNEDMRNLPEEALNEDNEKKILVLKKKITQCFRPRVLKFFGSYFEISAVACLLREKWIFLLSVFVSSRAALEIKDAETLISILFIIFSFCLTLQMIENILRYQYLKTTNAGAQKIECMFDLADKSLLLLSLLISGLHHYELISTWFLVVPPAFFFLEIIVYQRYYLVLLAQDDMKIITRIFYLLQSFMIAAKMNELVDSDWKGTLTFLWVYLGINAFHAFLTTMLVIGVFLVALRRRDIRNLSLLKSRILGYIWYISCYILNAVGLVILMGVFVKMSSGGDYLIQLGLELAKNFSLALMLYSAVLFPVLKKLNLSFIQSLGISCRNQVVESFSQRKYAIRKTESQNKLAFFSMISSTYFNQLKDVSEETVKKSESKDLEKNSLNEKFKQQQEENFCYICEVNASNAILTECGHGGICCECARQVVEQKSICMACRKPVQAIYKIDNKAIQDGKMVQAHELVQIIEI